MIKCQDRRGKKLETMINGYYFLVFCAALTFELAALSSLLVHRLSSILTPVLFVVCFLEILCCMLRFLQIKDMMEHCPTTCKADPNRRSHARYIGPWITAELLLIILGIYPMFPFWLKSMFQTSALALLLCLMLWSNKAYRKCKQYS